MIERTVTVASRNGLHARPASKFVQKVNDIGFAITVAKADGDPVDARSMMLVMSQNISYGDTVVLATDVPDADMALDELVDLLNTDLDADHA